VKGITETFSSQNARLLLGVRFESRLPLFQTGHKVTEIRQFKSTQSRHLKKRKLQLISSPKNKKKIE
jgi:hypothetical protein